MRERFDKTREEKDMRKLAAMVEEGEEELFRNQHFQPFVWKVINSAIRSSKRQSITKPNVSRGVPTTYSRNDPE